MIHLTHPTKGSIPKSTRQRRRQLVGVCIGHKNDLKAIGDQRAVALGITSIDEDDCVYRK